MSSAFKQPYSRAFAWRMGLFLTIFSFLLAALMRQFKNRQQEALIQRARSELRTLATALEVYYVRHANTFPGDLSGLVKDQPRLLNAPPLDPFGSARSYGYFKTLGKTSAYYLVFSYGPDRRQAITGISPEGRPQCAGGDCAGGIDDICATNGPGAGASNC